MPTLYPGALDSLTNPAGTDTMAAVDHAAQHIAINDAMEAVQSTLGANPQGGEATVAARLTAIEAGGGSGTLTVADVTLTAVTQSSTYSGVTSATISNMTDGSDTTGTGCNSGSGEYIEVQWSGTKAICAVRMQAGTLTAWGNQANYMNGLFRELQYWDGAAWAFLKIPDPASNILADSGLHSVVTIPVGPVSTTKLRFITTGAVFLGTNGFVPIELKIV